MMAEIDTQFTDKNISPYEEMYKENILDHYRNPRNAGRLEVCTFCHRELNISCGDAIELFVRTKSDGTIEEVRFDGQGCAISQAATSLLTEHIIDKRLVDLTLMGQDDIFALLGISVVPARVNCALLGLKALQKGIEKHLTTDRT